MDYRKRLVFVNDRESDVYEYLMHLLGEDLRFVIRASWDRRLDEANGKLWKRVQMSPVRGEIELFIEQRGGRPARTARLALRTTPVTLKSPHNGQESFPSLPIHAVYLKEEAPPEGVEGIEWMLLTTEPIDTIEQSLEVIRCYSLRWLVEEFHKCWKSGGMNVESLRMQESDNLLRIAVLMTFAAVRLMQLRSVLMDETRQRHVPRYLDDSPQTEIPTQAPSLASSPCDVFLPAVYWCLLWLATERRRPIPQSTPSCKWAVQAIARLGGWNDSKHTGRPGYRVIWQGWFRLHDLLEGYRAAHILSDSSTS